MNTKTFDEAQKAELAEKQVLASPTEKCMIEFALQDYPDKFADIILACKNIPGVVPADFVETYLEAVAMNLSTISPAAGVPFAKLAAAYADVFEVFVIKHLEDR